MVPENKRPNIVNLNDIQQIHDMIDVKQLNDEHDTDCERNYIRGSITRTYSLYLGGKIYSFDQFGSDCGHSTTDYKKKLADIIKQVIDQYHEDLSSKQ